MLIEVKNVELITFILLQRILGLICIAHEAIFKCQMYIFLYSIIRLAKNETKKSECRDIRKEKPCSISMRFVICSEQNEFQKIRTLRR